MTLEITAAVSALTIFFLVKSRINYLRLPELVNTVECDLTAVTVIVPARNEEKNIGRLLASLPPVRVIVVDDDSLDKTAEIARRAGAEVIPAPPLPRGAAGKPNACMAGARHTLTPYLLFLDADTWYRPGFLPALLQQSQANNLDLLTLFLKQERVNLWEKLVLPYAFALYFCGVNARNVNSRKSPEALANGQCMLCRREPYEFLGGHSAVLDSVVEDVQLAAIAKRHRLRVKVMRGERFGSVRMYDGLKAIFHGFEKNSFRFLLINRGGSVQVIAASILLTSYIPILLFLISREDYRIAAAYAILPILLLTPWYGSAAVVLAPVAIYVFQVIALSAMLNSIHGRRTVWKGRRV